MLEARQYRPTARRHPIGRVEYHRRYFGFPITMPTRPLSIHSGLRPTHRCSSRTEIASTASRAPTADGGCRPLIRVWRHLDAPVRQPHWQANWRSIPS